MLCIFTDEYASVLAKVALKAPSLDHTATLRDGLDRPGDGGRPTGGEYDPEMARSLSLTAVYEPVEGGWTQARIAELPAVITAAPTQEEAKDALLDALREYLLSLGDEDAAQVIDREVTREEFEVVLGA